ncbi:MAG: U32 family peptidase [Lachnospiraceae bacterium]|nr:U32 family peptidase [Lachnospiraceae bacterium]
MEVFFHLPGLRGNYALNMMFSGLLNGHPEYFREGVKIGSFFGEFPTSLWNGGRNSRADQCSADYINAVIKSTNDLGIPVRYTYTNMLLEEEDLKDVYCNYCLEAAHNGMNGVILVSPLLEKYVREKYPKMKLTSSTCKQIKDVSGIHEELNKGYDMVVLDYNMNNRFELLEQIEDKSRCEILVNAVCEPNCARRGAHYRNISENQKKIVKNMGLPREQQIPLTPWECKYAGIAQENIYTIQKFCTYVSPEDIWEKYVPMGFRNFKIEGRTSSLFVVMEAYCHYMIKPEYQGQVRLQLLRNMESLKLLQVNRPQPAPFRLPNQGK